jgi:hypothetical protein
MTTGMFDDEADTISVDPGFDTKPVAAINHDVDAFEATQPIELKSADTLREQIAQQIVQQSEQIEPVEQIELEDTDILIASKIAEEASVTDVDVGRPKRAGTNADWPPTPKVPADRKHRRAGMYKAISSITKLNSLRRIGSSNS